jgi:hypothetical protein
VWIGGLVVVVEEIIPNLTKHKNLFCTIFCVGFYALPLLSI